MTILEKIIDGKRTEVDLLKKAKPVSKLEKSTHFSRKPLSLREAITSRPNGIIAEFKRSSPSAGIINGTAVVSEVCRDYESAGVSAISVLTDKDFFGGSLSDLTEARDSVGCPVLRKDFIIDQYQLIEARSAGADAVLLIAELHDRDRLERLFDFALSLGLEVLLEIHDRNSIAKIPARTSIVGINSRNLASLAVNIGHPAAIAGLLPGNILKVAESGIGSTDDYLNLRNAGFSGFLIGEYFMRNNDPGSACRTFIEQIENEKNKH